VNNAIPELAGKAQEFKKEKSKAGELKAKWSSNT